VEARKIIEEGKKDALVLKDRLRDEGKKEKEAELNRARREIGLAKDKALSELHQAVGDLSLSIASQILEKELSARDHRKLIEKALKETETVAREG
jgi:F-type H+-transporting ATPase subunit b